MEFNFKKNEKLTKIITIILAGILILIVIMPVKDSVSNMEKSRSKDETTEADYTYYAEYYESKLKNILEKSYGEGTMQVMVRVSVDNNPTGLYSENKVETVVEGVIVVADVDDINAISDITFAVCALFDLPAHRVAVMIKN